MSANANTTAAIIEKLAPITANLQATEERKAQLIGFAIEEIKDRCWFQADVPVAIAEACYLYRRGLITAEEAEIEINAAEDLYLAAAQ